MARSRNLRNLRNLHSAVPKAVPETTEISEFLQTQVSHGFTWFHKMCCQDRESGFDLVHLIQVGSRIA